MRVAAALLLVTLAGVARGQTIQVSGTVVDERQAPISGATVRLTGDRSATTGANGRFEFSDAIAGRYLITATAIGHQLQTIDISIQRDTSLTIMLPRRSVTLDTVVVRPRSVRIKGTAVDSASGDFLLQAQATLYPGGRFVGAVSGVFVFDSVPPGPTTLVIEAYEHLPAQVELDLVHDTVFRVRMGVDSVALRMTAMQVRRLEQRSHGIAMPTTSLNRDALQREGASNLYELLMRRIYADQYAMRQTFVNPPDSACYFVDESKVALQTLEGMQPELVERIEIYRSAGAPAPSLGRRSAGTRNFGTVKMVRIYTKRYVSTLPRQDVLPRIVYMGTGLKPTCQ
jgi:hypothetical protein